VEAAAYGMPVLFGPNYHHFREAERLIAAGAARSVKNGEELCTAMNEALNDHTAIGEKAAAYVENELGATEKIYNDIFK
jgi:3-deoxy-D-manno-octulosonic-acid transferase